MLRISVIAILSLVISQNSIAQKDSVLSVPGKDLFCKIDTEGYSVLPSGRLVKPAGQVIRITHDPFGMALSPDGKYAITLHDGVVTRINLNRLETVRIPSYDGKIKTPLDEGSFLGVAFHPVKPWV